MGNISETITAIKTINNEAAETIIDAADDVLKSLHNVSHVESVHLARIRISLCTIIEACVFHDLTGQHLENIRNSIGAQEVKTTGEVLLNGPAVFEEGLTQLAADALMTSAIFE